MTPAARLQAAIELVAALQGEGFARPADAHLAAWSRRNRFAGSGDRRGIGDRLFGMLRHWGRLHAALDAADCSEPDARAVALAHLLLAEGTDPAAAAALFDAGGYGPAPLSADEAALAGRLADGRTGWPGALPDWARREHPAWLGPALAARFGDAIDAELAAFTQPAALDLRANTLKGGRDAARAALAADGILAEPTPHGRDGLRVAGRADLRGSQAYRDGLVEVQDESSQIAAALVDAAPGMAVCDFCAGAGGKTLALAASMQGRGRLVACDVEAGRLGRMLPRLARAGAAFAEAVTLSDTEDDPWCAEMAGGFDRVLVDAPCSGSGTWRRAPDARWRFADPQAGPAMLDGIVARQRAILRRAAGLVRPGGRLVYATCAILEAENEAVVAGLLDAAPEFTALPAAPIWAERVDGPCPESAPFVMMSPHRCGTDGFFVAVLERRRAA